MTNPNDREWVVHDNDSLRAALQAIQRKRKLTLEDLYHRMGGRLLNRFFQNKQDNLQTSTIWKAQQAMGFEIVIREPRTSKTQQRLAKLREQQQAQRDTLLQEAAEEVVLEQTGLGVITPELRAEVDRMLKEFHNPDKLLNPINGD